MKIIRSYASPDKAVNIQNIIAEMLQLELEKMVNTTTVNSPASHERPTLEGDCA